MKNYLISISIVVFLLFIGTISASAGLESECTQVANNYSRNFNSSYKYANTDLDFEYVNGVQSSLALQDQYQYGTNCGKLEQLSTNVNFNNSEILGSQKQVAIQGQNMSGTGAQGQYQAGFLYQTLDGRDDQSYYSEKKQFGDFEQFQIFEQEQTQ